VGRLHERQLDDDAPCRVEIDARAVGRARQFGDFEARFRSGAERFDSPGRVFALGREPAHNPRLHDTSADRPRSSTDGATALLPLRQELIVGVEEPDDLLVGEGPAATEPVELWSGRRFLSAFRARHGRECQLDRSSANAEDRSFVHEPLERHARLPNARTAA
jgi:hypothetical protein